MTRDHHHLNTIIADLSERMVGVEVGIAALNEKFDTGLATLHDKVDSVESHQRERNHAILTSIASADARGQQRGIEQARAIEKLSEQILEKRKTEDSVRLSYGVRALMFLGTIVMALIGFIYLNDIGRAH